MKRAFNPLVLALLLPACAQGMIPSIPFDVPEPAAAVTPATGAAFTTTNPHVDFVSGGVGLNGVVNCNVYRKTEYVWLNGGPESQRVAARWPVLFALLDAGGMANLNDGGDHNLSDDYDAYTNRVFTVTYGEVSRKSPSEDRADG